MVAMLLLSGFRLVARPIHVVGESTWGVCGVGAWGLSWLRTFIRVPKKLDMDAFQYRTVSKLEYVTRLAALDKLLIVSSADVTTVDDWALCFARVQLSLDFRFIEQPDLWYWTNYIRNESRVREKTRYAVLYCQYLTPSNIAFVKKKFVFAKLTVGWSRNQVPMGCYVELPLIFSYKESAMMNPSSGHWMVGYTKFFTKTAAFILFDS